MITRLSSLPAQPGHACQPARCTFRAAPAAQPHRAPPAARAVAEDAQTAAGEEARADICQTCGASLEKAARGCDRRGRIVGGIGAVPGFDWWPIKAYRPCPALAEAGLNYTRKGQIVDEMLFGKPKQRKQ